MKLLSIALKNIKQNLRRPVTLILLVVLPVALIWLLGAAFEGIITSAPGNLRFSLCYYSDREGPFSEAFRLFLSAAEESGGESFSVSDPERGRNMVRRGEVEGFVLLNEQTAGLELLLNDNSGFSAGIMQAYLAGFLNRYNTHAALFRQVPEFTGVKGDTGDALTIRREVVPSSPQPGSRDYFGIVILTLLIMWGSFVGAHGVIDERSQRTLDRIATAPVKGAEIFGGICLGTFFSLLIQVGAVLLVARFVLNVNYGSSILTPVLLLAECFYALALGIFLGGLIRDNKTLNGVLNLVVQVQIFLGGGYMKLPDEGGWKILVRFSPLTWINEALFRQIYPGTGGDYLPALLLCLGAGSLLLGAAAALGLKRRKI